MTTKNMDARRGAFEAWFESLNHYKPDKAIGTQSWWYSEPRVSDAWCVWNAALDSIYVELPESVSGRAVFPYKSYEGGWNDALAACQEALTAAGVRFK